MVYQSKYKFQNPLRQTYRHKKVLSNHLRIKENNIHQIVSFVGDCQFKTDMPSNVIQSDLGSYIKEFNKVVFSDDEVNQIENILSRLKSEVSVSTEKHIQFSWIFSLEFTKNGSTKSEKHRDSRKID